MFLSQFHHQISGNPSGHKLVFLHGLMGSMNNWRRIVPAFENDFHILIYDQRGHGRSFQPTSGYQAHDYASDLAGILDELGWAKIDLVGHSMGGRVALEFSHENPQRTAKLVIEDIPPGGAKEPMDVIERLIALVPTPFPTREAARDFFEKKYESLISWHPQPKVIAAFLNSNIEGKPNGGWDWRFYKPGILETLRRGHAKEHWEWVDQLQIPTLWLRGAQSTDLIRPTFDQILERNPKIKGVEIPNSGHWIHFDQPEAFTRVVKEFLTSRA